MPSTIKFEVNVPRVVALAFAEGKEVESRFGGIQLMFSTTSGERFYVPPIVGEQLRAKGVAANQQIELCKAQVGNQIEWRVRTHNELASVVVATPAVSTNRTADGSRQTSAYANGNAHLDCSPDALPCPSQAPRLAPSSLAMMGALCAAVDAVIETEIYGARQGRDVKFSEESIRAIACTIFIQDTRGRA